MPVKKTKSSTTPKPKKQAKKVVPKKPAPKKLEKKVIDPKVVFLAKLSEYNYLAGNKYAVSDVLKCLPKKESEKFLEMANTIGASSYISKAQILPLIETLFRTK